MEAHDPIGGDAPEARPRRARARTKTATGPAADAGAKPKPEKRSLNLRVDVETYERLTIHAMKRRATISELVEELAKDHLREYTMSKRVGARGGQDPDPESDPGE